MMISGAINSMIRADGSPKYAMFSMVIGAVLNVILDAVFIFPLQMGVQGAAIATVIVRLPLLWYPLPICPGLRRSV